MRASDLADYVGRRGYSTVFFLLILKAFAELIRSGWYVSSGDFASLYERVRSIGVNRECRYSCEAVCRAMDLACACYWKKALCLHRAAATTCLLRRCGTEARMVIAAQRMPFKAHAWVEVQGKVVNEQPSVTTEYMVLDKC